MKLSSLLVLVFLASSVQAEVKLPGAILVTECAQNIRALGREQFSERLPRILCFVNVVGDRKSYLMMDNTLWETIESSGNLVLRKAGIDDRGYFLVRQYEFGREARLFGEAMRIEGGVEIMFPGQAGIRGERLEGRRAL